MLSLYESMNRGLEEKYGLAEAEKDSFQDLINKLQRLESEDYQKRDGRYPEAGIPVDINLNGSKDEVWLTASFKNTTKAQAKQWMQDYMKQNNLTPYEITATPGGDSEYEDDWVEAIASFRKKSEGLKGEVEQKLLAIGQPNLSVQNMRLVEEDGKINLYYHTPGYRYDNEDVIPVITRWLAKAGLESDDIFLSRWGKVDNLCIFNIK